MFILLLLGGITPRLVAANSRALGDEWNTVKRCYGGGLLAADQYGQVVSTDLNRPVRGPGNVIEAKKMYIDFCNIQTHEFEPLHI